MKKIKSRKVKVLLGILIGIFALYCIKSIYVAERTLREEPRFGASWAFDGMTKYGDMIIIKYNGYYYASQNNVRRYGFSPETKLIEEPITRIMDGQWWYTKDKNYVWGYEGDAGRLLLECDYNISFAPVEAGPYYRADIDFPLVSERTVASIDFYEIDENNEEILVESNNNEKTIKYWTKKYAALFSDSDHNYLICDCTDHEFDEGSYNYHYDYEDDYDDEDDDVVEENERDVYCVYATFKDSPFVCRLGYIYPENMVVFN